METATPRSAILILGGSFNPVHLQHIHLFYVARRHLETAHSPPFRVVAGYCAVTSHGYLVAKMAQTAAYSDGSTNTFTSLLDAMKTSHTRPPREKSVLKFAHRERLVRMALATAPPPPSTPSAPPHRPDTRWLTDPRVAPPIVRQPFVDARELGIRLQRHWMEETGIRVTPVVIWGSDKLDPDYAFWQFPDPLALNIVVGRDGQMRELVERRRRDVEAGLDRWHVILCEGEGEVGAMSSTQLRALLWRLHEAGSPAAKEAVAVEILRSGFMSDEQIRYILANESELYA